MMDAASEMQQGHDQFSESAYTPYKLMSWRLMQLRGDFEGLLRAPSYYNNAFRKRMVDSARILYHESKNTGFTDMERIKLEGMLNQLQRLDDQIVNILAGFAYISGVDASSKGVLDVYVKQFEDAAYRFLSSENHALQMHGQLYKTKQRIEQIERLEKVFVMKNKNFFYNSFGIPISLEIETMARILVQRVRNKLDNFFPIEGDTGFGKTTFAWALGSTVAGMLGRPFSVASNFLFNEDATYVENRFRTAEKEDVIIADEFGNQANKRRFYQEGQVNFMDRLKLLRFHGLTVLACWPSVDELDGQLQTKIHGIFSIQKRGVAQLRTFNRNRYAKKKEFVPYGARNMTAFTPEEGNRIVEEFDDFNLLTLPFYEIPSTIWMRDYDPVKESANQVGRASSVNAKRTAEKLYYEFIVQLPDDCTRISYTQLMEFAKSKNFVLDFGALVKKISEGIGVPRTKLFHMDMDAKTRWEGWVDVDDFVKGWVNRIKAQYRGAKTVEDEGTL